MIKVPVIVQHNVLECSGCKNAYSPDSVLDDGDRCPLCNEHNVPGLLNRTDVISEVQVEIIEGVELIPDEENEDVVRLVPTGEPDLTKLQELQYQPEVISVNGEDVSHLGV